MRIAHCVAFLALVLGGASCSPAPESVTPPPTTKPVKFALVPYGTQFTDAVVTNIPDVVIVNDSGVRVDTAGVVVAISLIHGTGVIQGNTTATTNAFGYAPFAGTTIVGYGPQVLQYSVSGLGTLTDTLFGGTPKADTAQFQSWGNTTCGAIYTPLLFCWGQNDHGQLGDGTLIDRPSGILVNPTPGQGDGFNARIAAPGGDHSCGRAAQIWCWGNNSFGQLGTGNTTTKLVPQVLPGTDGYISIAAGLSHTCGIAPSHNAFCWGLNANGELGNGTQVNSTTPTAVTGGIQFVALSASDHTCAIAIDARMYCWGRNNAGQLGDGTTTDRPVPTLVQTQATFVTVSAREATTCALSTLGEVYCWGDNTFGQIGDGTAANRLLPTRVGTNLVWRQVSTGGTHTCAVTYDYVTYCWGDNRRGQLGNGNTTSQLSPTQVDSRQQFRLLAPGRDHTCGLVRNSGFAWCWGANDHGQLGDGTFVDHLRPVENAFIDFGHNP